jgi:hypothetical protein
MLCCNYNYLYMYVCNGCRCRLAWSCPRRMLPWKVSCSIMWCSTAPGVSALSPPSLPFPQHTLRLTSLDLTSLDFTSLVIHYWWHLHHCPVTASITTSYCLLSFHYRHHGWSWSICHSWLISQCKYQSMTNILVNIIITTTTQPSLAHNLIQHILSLPPSPSLPLSLPPPHLSRHSLGRGLLVLRRREIRRGHWLHLARARLFRGPDRQDHGSSLARTIITLKLLISAVSLIQLIYGVSISSIFQKSIYYSYTYM